MNLNFKLQLQKKAMGQSYGDVDFYQLLNVLKWCTVLLSLKKLLFPTLYK